MTFASSFALAATALILEALIGYPDWLFRAIRHPVTWIGALIQATEMWLNRPEADARQQKLAGLASLLFWLICAGLCGLVLTWLCGTSPVGWLVLALLATSLLAQRSLYQHVEAVADALAHEGLDEARAAIGRIVGRETAVLDAAAIARAAIESLAENFSDGVVAPAFWLAVGGLTGGLLYKTINTADSMIGHRTPRYANYGWASARLDDLVNLPASRFAALLLAVAAGLDNFDGMRNAIKAALCDASKHLSPNAGWPEAAMAGALGLKLGGPRTYGDSHVDGAFMGDGRSDATVKDIHRALVLFRRAAALEIGLYALLALVIWRA
jgi:adenosylcobinamide-phosphate synthase